MTQIDARTVFLETYQSLTKNFSLTYVKGNCNVTVSVLRKLHVIVFEFEGFRATAMVRSFCHRTNWP